MPTAALQETTSTSGPAGTIEDFLSAAADSQFWVYDADDDSPLDLALGEYTTSWTSHGQADIGVLSADLEVTERATLLVVRVNYECYDGEFPFAVADWTVTTANGRRHHPQAESGFYAESRTFGTMVDWSTKNGVMVFEVSQGPFTVEFDAISGEPATWVVPVV